MKKKLFAVLLLMLVLIGCSNDLKSSENIVKASILPVGANIETYLFNIKSNGLFEVSYGNRKSDDITNKSFLEEESIKRDKKLSTLELESLTKLINDIDKKKVISVKDNVSGGRMVVILINDKIYSFYEGEHENDCFGEFKDKLIEFSPLKVEPNRFY